MRRLAVLMIGISGISGACGEVTGTIDAAVPSDVTIDAPSSVRCNPAAPFGTPQLVAGLNPATVSDTGGRLSPDELSIYFSRGVANEYDLFVATRSQISDSFSNPAALAGVNTTAGAFSPSVTADQLSVYFGGPVNGSSTDYGIYTALRTSSSQSFGTGTLIAAADTIESEGDPYVVPDGSALYFERGTPATTFNLWRSARSTNGGFDPPVRVDELVSTVQALFPVVSPDERTIYFARSVGIGAGITDYEIYTATRASAAVRFGTAVAVAEVNSMDWDWPTWISNDGCALYLARGQRTGSLWVAVRGR